MSIHYIYKITCLCGTFKGHYYIGKRSSRKEDILNDYYYGSGEKLRRYYKKYPPVLGETINKEIIEINPTKEDNCRREKEIIGDLYITDPLCLNLMEGGNGRKVSKETSEKKSKENKGKKLSDETKAKMRAARIRDNSVASLEKYYETHDVWNKGKTGLYGKPVACYNLDGSFVKVYNNTRMAEIECGISLGGVTNCITHPDKFHRAGHFMFTPISEDLPLFIEPYSEKQKIRYSFARNKVNQYTQDGVLIKTWDSIQEAAKSFGYKSGCVMHKIIDKPFEPRNNENNIYNFIWKKAS